MIERPLTADSLEWALSRMEDFYVVHRGNGVDSMKDALSVLRHSLGIDDDMFVRFGDWVEEFQGHDDETAAIFLGFLMGVMAAAHNYES